MADRPSLLRTAATMVLLSALLGLATAFLHPHAPGYREGRMGEGEISLANVLRFEGAVLWVDARTEREFLAGHIPGAVLVSEDDWETGLMNFFMAYEPGALVVVYCGEAACQSSKAVADRLRRESGFENIHYLQGGWESWLAAN